MVVQRQLAAPATSAGDPICGLRTMTRDKVSCVVCIGASQGGLCGGGRQQGKGAAMGSKLRAGSFHPSGFMLHTPERDSKRSAGTARTMSAAWGWVPSTIGRAAFGLMCLVADFRSSRQRRKGTAV